MSPRVRRAAVVVAVATGALGALACLVRWWAAEPAAVAAARVALDRREFVAAGELLDAHLAARPDDPAARLLAAQAARRRGDVGAAGGHLKRYEQGGGAAEVARREWSLLAAHRGTPDGFDRLLQAAEAAPPPDRRLILEALAEGNLNAVARPFSQHPAFDASGPVSASVVRARVAADRYLEAAESPTDRAEGLVWRARCRELSGDHPGAVADLRAAVALVPDHVHATYLLALFQTQEAPAETRAGLEALAARYPDDPRFLFPLASCLRRLGDLKGADRVLDRLLEKTPTDPQVLLERAMLRLDQQDPAAAEPILRAVMGAAPTDREAGVALARCLRLLGRPDDAVRIMDRLPDPALPKKL